MPARGDPGTSVPESFTVPMYVPARAGANVIISALPTQSSDASTLAGGDVALSVAVTRARTAGVHGTGLS